jgi:AraC-like DNA-binding protein
MRLLGQDAAGLHFPPPAFVSQSLIDILCGAAAAAMALQSLFLGLALIAHPGRRSHANLALAVASLAFAVAQLENVLRHWTEDVPRTEYFWAASHLPILLIPPFAYLHIVGLTSGESWRFKLRDLRHGVFCFAAPLLLAAATLLDSEKLAATLIQGMFLITALQGGYYLMAALALTRHGATPQIAWLRLLLMGLAAFLALFAIVHALPFFFEPSWLGLASTVVAMLVLYAIAWASLSHNKAFAKPPKELLNDLVAPLDKYRKSRQSAEDANRILIKLDHAVLAEGLYRDSALTLPTLAAKVGAKPNIVSQALNQTLGMTFFDYINGHRIDEAKRLLAGAGETTILDVAYEVGFNSKSTFNAAFKKRTGQTPSLFRKQKSPRASL